MGLEEQVFVRAGVGQRELDASHGVDDFGAELQKFQAYGIGDGLGQGRLFQGDAADTVDEDIGESSEEQAVSLLLTPSGAETLVFWVS